MSSIRRFLVAPALVRLIRKERGGARITEGHFAPQAGRTSYVRVDGGACHLVLVNGGIEERTDVPRAHGDALLDVCPGKAAYDRTTLSVAGREVTIDRYVTPGGLDLVTVAFEGADDAAAFSVPAWFGREVSTEAAYERSALAIQGVPGSEEVALSNAALDAVLDLIEPRFGFGRYGATTRAGEAGETFAPRRNPAPIPEPLPVHAPETVADAHPEPAPPEPVHAAPEPSAPAAEAPPEPHHAPAHHAPAHGEAPHLQAPAAEPATPAEAVHSDARIDDVIESLSQALGAAIQQAPPPAESKDKGEEAPVFERWTVRPRRTQQT